jgi:capsular polysaccharide biosynthesis protein
MYARSENMQEVTIKELWSMVKKRLWLILAFCILVTVSAGVYYWRQPDEYTAEATLTVKLGYQDNNYDQPVFDVSASTQFSKDFPELVNTPPVMERAAEILKVSVDYFSAAAINLSRAPDSNVLYLTATSLQQDVSMDVANAVSEAFTVQRR